MTFRRTSAGHRDDCGSRALSYAGRRGAAEDAGTHTCRHKDLPPISQRLMQLDSIYFAPVEWSGTMPMMNWASTGRQVRWIVRDAETRRENMDVDWRLRRGEPVRIRLVNQRQSVHAMQHPIHFHGQRFLMLAVNGEPTPEPGLEGHRAGARGRHGGYSARPIESRSLDGALPYRRAPVGGDDDGIFSRIVESH